MKDTIWTTFMHYSFSDNHRQHEKCPSSEDSWCAWQRVAASDELESFLHDYNPLPTDGLEVMRPNNPCVYTEGRPELILKADRKTQTAT